MEIPSRRLLVDAQERLNPSNQSSPEHRLTMESHVIRRLLQLHSIAKSVYEASGCLQVTPRFISEKRSGLRGARLLTFAYPESALSIAHAVMTATEVGENDKDFAVHVLAILAEQGSLAAKASLVELVSSPAERLSSHAMWVLAQTDLVSACLFARVTSLWDNDVEIGFLRG